MYTSLPMNNGNVCPKIIHCLYTEPYWSKYFHRYLRNYYINQTFDYRTTAVVKNVQAFELIRNIERLMRYFIYLILCCLVSSPVTAFPK